MFKATNRFLFASSNFFLSLLIFVLKINILNEVPLRKVSISLAPKVVKEMFLIISINTRI